MSVKWLVTGSVVAVFLDQLNWLSANSWYAGWIGFFLAVAAAVMLWMGK